MQLCHNKLAGTQRRTQVNLSQLSTVSKITTHAEIDNYAECKILSRLYQDSRCEQGDVCFVTKTTSMGGTWVIYTSLDSLTLPFAVANGVFKLNN